MCECGCGLIPPIGKRFLRGHWNRTPEAQAMYERRRRKGDGPNPSGLCMCGCGQSTKLANRNRNDGDIKGKPVRYIHGHYLRGKKGEVHPQWKGGRWKHKSGYIYIYAPEHPNNRDGYVLEHRYVFEQSLGRLLEENEHVHHIDGNKTNNVPENLMVMNPTDHAKLHPGEILRQWHKEDRKDVQSKRGKRGAEVRWNKARRLRELNHWGEI